MVKGNGWLIVWATCAAVAVHYARWYYYQAGRRFDRTTVVFIMTALCCVFLAAIAEM